jgi:hypothetical protein
MGRRESYVDERKPYTVNPVNKREKTDGDEGVIMIR